MVIRCPNCYTYNNLDSEWCVSCSHFLIYQCQHCTLINSISEQRCEGCGTPGPHIEMKAETELKTNITFEAVENQDTSATETIVQTDVSEEENLTEEDHKQLVSHLRQIIQGNGSRNDLRTVLQRIFERNTDNFIEPFVNYANEKKIPFKKQDLLDYSKKYFIFLSPRPSILLSGFGRMAVFLLHSETYEKQHFETINQNNEVKEVPNDEKKQELYYVKLIFIPMLRSYLSMYYDISEYEVKLTEETSLELDKKQKPIKSWISKAFNELKTHSNKEHSCMCYGEQEDNLIYMPCCKKEVHKECIMTWFKNGDDCPYCKEKKFDMLKKI